MSKFITFLKKDASLRKRAVTGWAGLTDEMLENVVGLIPYAIGVPLAGGSAVGYLASKMSSPSDSDREALQERVMDVKVREELGLQQRKLETLKKRLKELKKAQKDTARKSRKRDPFV